MEISNKLPNNWKICKFKEIIDGSPQNGYYKLNMEYGCGDFNIIRMVDLYRGDYLPNKHDKINLSKTEAKNFLLKKGDLLLNRTSLKLDGVGKSSVFTGENEDYIFDCSIIKVSINPKLADPIYVMKFLNSKYGKIQIRRIAKTVTISTINQPDVLSINIILPPLPIQHQIVAVLEKAEVVKRQRQEADALTGALLQSVFSEMFGDPVRNERGWEVMELEKLSSHIIDCPHSTPECEEIITPYPCIRTTELKDGYIDWTKMKYLNEKNYVERIRRLTPEEGDLVFGREGSFGVAVRVPKNVKICLGQRVMLFRPDRKYCNSEFLWALLNSDAILRQANSKTSGSTVAHINVTDIKKFDGICPPLALQQQFARVVESVERIRDQQVASGKEIEGLCEGLVQRAFAGDIAH